MRYVEDREHATKTKPKRLSHRMVTLPYAVLAALWIAVTDAVVSWTVHDPELFIAWQIGKGWVFVAATSLLLGILVQRASTRIGRTVTERDEYVRRLSTLIGNLSGIVYRCKNDRNWTLEYLEGDSEELLGYDATAFQPPKAITYAEVIHPDDRDRVFEQVQAAVDRRRTFKLRYRVLTKDGQTRWMAEQGCGVFDARGELLALEGYIYGVTEQVLLEQAMQRIDKMNMLERVVGCAAHDFNNYLAAVAMSMECLRDELDGFEQREEAQAIEQATSAAIGLSRELLTFARRAPPIRQRIAMNEFIDARTDLLRTLARASTTVSVELSDEPLYVHASAAQLEQLLTNLVVNAADAVGARGHIGIETGVVDEARDEVEGQPNAAGPFARLRVADDGEGIAEEIRPRLFEPFFTTKGSRGTGLGLASVHGIVKELSGYIAVDSTAGEGTTFDIYLPLVEAEQEERSEVA